MKGILLVNFYFCFLYISRLFEVHCRLYYLSPRFSYFVKACFYGSTRSNDFWLSVLVVFSLLPLFPRLGFLYSVPMLSMWFTLLFSYIRLAYCFNLCIFMLWVSLCITCWSLMCFVSLPDRFTVSYTFIRLRDCFSWYWIKHGKC